MPPGSVGRHRASDGSPARRGSIEVWIAESERDRVEAARAGTLPDVMQLPMALAHEYARRRILNADAAQDVVRDLGQDTFSARALSLLTTEGRVAAVPSDGWGQLLIYRKDLFDAAGLPEPRSLQDVPRAAQRLDRGRMAGITLATGADTFTAESFEHVALAAGCQLTDDSGASPRAATSTARLAS